MKVVKSKGKTLKRKPTKTELAQDARSRLRGTTGGANIKKKTKSRAY
jgi:hypothetical protein|tara:strand:+ start:1857 stop:1997 length:141 start_codon:yes stop_codon:yes gene_type:complete